MQDPTTRGLAGLSPERRRAIASKGGRSAHAQGRAHQYSPAEAAAAGRLGGLAVSADRARMAAIGAIGGRKRGKLGGPVHAGTSPDQCRARLWQVLADSGTSQQAAARLLDIDPRTLRRYCAGEGAPSASYVERMRLAILRASRCQAPGK